MFVAAHRTPWAPVAVSGRCVVRGCLGTSTAAPTTHLLPGGARHVWAETGISRRPIVVMPRRRPKVRRRRPRISDESEERRDTGPGSWRTPEPPGCGQGSVRTGNRIPRYAIVDMTCGGCGLHAGLDAILLTLSS